MSFIEYYYMAYWILVMGLWDISLCQIISGLQNLNKENVAAVVTAADKVDNILMLLFFIGLFNTAYLDMA